MTMHRPAFAANGADPALMLQFSRTRTAVPAMATSDDISGLPLQTGQQFTAHALAQRGGVVLADNDNIHRTLRPAHGYSLDRHERDAAVHGLGYSEQVREAGPMWGERKQLGVLRQALKNLRGGLQIKGTLRGLFRRWAVGTIPAHDLRGEAAGLDGERCSGSTAGAAEGHQAVGVGDHDGLQAGDRHRAKALTRVDGGDTR